MRKWFWCCAAATAVVTGGAYLASKKIQDSPYTVISNLMKHWAGEQPTPRAGVEMPEGGVLPDDPIAVLTEPVPAECDQQIVAMAEALMPAHISIDDGNAHAQLPEPSEACEHVAIVPVGAELPVAAPAYMPYADDDSTPAYMPYADDQVVQAVAEEVEAVELPQVDWAAVIGNIVRSVFGGKCDEAEPVPEKGDDEPAAMPGQGENRFPDHHPYPDYHHHQHDQVCPYSGRSYPLPTPSPALPEVTKEKKETTPEEASEPKKAEVLPVAPKEREEPKADEPPAPPQGQGGKLSRKMSREEQLEEQEMHPNRWDLDTMEFRPSDAGLQRFIPGPL